MIKYEELLVNTKVYKALESDLLEDRLNHCYMIMSEDALAVDGLCTLFARKILCKLYRLSESRRRQSRMRIRAEKSQSRRYKRIRRQGIRYGRRRRQGDDYQKP